MICSSRPKLLVDEGKSGSRVPPVCQIAKIESHSPRQYFLLLTVEHFNFNFGQKNWRARLETGPPG
jgi:hypothetical protein